jgi:four helix bundle protein
MHDFRNLEVWKIARHVTFVAYEVAGAFPQGKGMQTLASQIQQICVSLLATIAEAYDKNRITEKTALLLTVHYSATQLEQRFLQACQNGLLSCAGYHQLQEELCLMQRSFV